ncbi:MAG: hypothetical protein HYV15_05530 [Elusimicrobia bacterium]|nr:hypothetical protein [Elusimicrobiota bacterium]
MASAALAQTRTSGDAAVTGAMGVGTLTPRAPLEVVLQSTDTYALKVSSVDGTALFLLDRSGKTGLGVTPGGARLDVSGRADVGEVGLELRAGNSSSSVTSAQIAFGDQTGAYRHNIRTRSAGQNEGNGVDFYLWTATDAPNALGSFDVMSLQVGTAANMGAMQVIPGTTTANVELVVSSTRQYGGGTIRLGSIGTHGCFAALKSDIRHLDDGEREQGVRDVMTLKPVSFHYGRDSVQRKGLVYEEAPKSVRGPHGTIVLDQRLLNVELALQAARQRVAALEAEIARLEKGGGR